ncbi:CoA transferase [Paraburkholderia sp. NMBU_R16]|uniref:CaiB/BaiF CoA transferase family protein n=1 Tax=Paraburkholderia sp. NMBU_R16 TaxID=2698676 RepID=UPI00156411E8|nr:CoA transferase [Paraburkholderia sp. NMBU_R16]NRO98051.1 CoA transferase [Paraburkholderia sp. NMBU_R16]
MQSETTPVEQKGLLSGITVVDMTRVLSGPYATMILRQLGARVIKIERPGAGDDARAFGPFLNEKSTYFTALNCGKESIALDIKQSDDRDILHALLGQADVLVENFRPGVMRRYGLDHETLSERYPWLIYGSVSGFGQTGPYQNRPAYDIVVQAMSGLMSVTGQPGGAPTRVGVSVGDITAGLYLAIGINAALYERERTGVGRYLDVAMLDCQVAILEDALTGYAATGEVPRPQGARHPSVAPFSAFHAADTYFVIGAANDGLFEKLCNALERPDLRDDSRYRTNALRRENVDALTAQLERTLAGRNAHEWIALLQEAGVPCGPINSVADLVDDEQLNERNMVVAVKDAKAGVFQVAGNPIKISGIADARAYPAAPELDADRARIVAEFVDDAVAPMK